MEANISQPSEPRLAKPDPYQEVDVMETELQKRHQGLILRREELEREVAAVSTLIGMCEGALQFRQKNQPTTGGM